MSHLIYRVASETDLPAMARVRATEWETEEFWINRISRYLNYEHHPQKALMPRVCYVALDGDTLAGYIAGHLAQRFECDGELQWINVLADYRRHGVASELLRHLAGWFSAQHAHRMCVNVDPGNSRARTFYMRHGAENLNEHWLVWNDIKVVLVKHPGQ